MSDGSPVLGPKVARPYQGAPRSSPSIEQSAGSNGLPGVVVIPWRLAKPAEYREVANGGPSTIHLPIDVAFIELE